MHINKETNSILVRTNLMYAAMLQMSILCDLQDDIATD